MPLPRKSLPKSSVCLCEGRMKRKKWSELEEKTLLTKYSDLVRTGTLPKLKTREKKFKPIADHVNSLHHVAQPALFPFRWSWRDVSVKIQNMRHQYLGVKLKIRLQPDRFDWRDGDNHWENFSLYRAVFGDVELEESGTDDGEGEDEEMGREVARMREDAIRREERRREREEERECKRREKAVREVEDRDLVPEEDARADPDLDFEMKWHKREIERRSRVEWEMRRRREVEERWEEEEMGWREKVVGMQLEHERQMMQMHAEACHNQMQIIGTMARLISQFFGPTSDSLGVLAPHQVLGSLQHHNGELGGEVKPDSNSPSEFL